MDQKPTIGRIVHYYPTAHDILQIEADANRVGARVVLQLGATPIAAIVTAVRPDNAVSLRLFSDAATVPLHRNAVLPAVAGQPCIGRWVWPPREPPAPPAGIAPQTDPAAGPVPA